MSVQRFALILIGFAAVLAVFVLLMRYRRQKAAVALRAYKKDYEAADHGPTASVPPTAAKRLMSVDVHYQLRSLVDDFPSMRSPTYLDYVEDYWVNERNRPEFNTYMIYKARWMRHCYPGPPTEVCELYQRTGRERCFVSIESD